MVLILLSCLGKGELEFILAQYHAVHDIPLVPTSNFKRQIVACL